MVTSATVSAPTVAKCLLCLRTLELRDSHFVPKALYRLVRAGSRGQHPLQITADGQRQTSRQAVQRLLCADCESRFDRIGENWVLRHCYRGRGVFRLRTLLETSNPIHVDAGTRIYNAATVRGVSIKSLVYFCTSVFWRASVADWWSSGRKYEAISFGDVYQEEIRRYLLGETEFPRNAAVTIIISTLSHPVLAFNFPVSIRIEFGRSHRLHIPGITFLLLVGKDVPGSLGEACILRAAAHPVFVSNEGDERVQKEIMRLMGKVAPAWAEYPLVDGTERP